MIAGFGASLRGGGEVLLGVGVIERAEQSCAAAGRSQLLSDGGAVIERGADVQFERIMKINDLAVLTNDVIETARSTLVIGDT